MLIFRTIYLHHHYIHYHHHHYDLNHHHHPTLYHHHHHHHHYHHHNQTLNLHILGLESTIEKISKNKIICLVVAIS